MRKLALHGDPLAGRLPEGPLAGQDGRTPQAHADGPSLVGSFARKEGRAGCEVSGDKKKAVWLPDAKTARQWMQFVQDTEVEDKTPPPAPTHLKIKDNVLTWKARADFESGLSHFIIERDGEKIGTVPERPGNRFDALFQGLQYSDTPAFPLVQMTFMDKGAEDGKKHSYRVVAVNTAGLRSK